MIGHTARSAFLRLCASFGIALMLVCGPLASSAEAAVGGCRADPIITLSDGTVMDVTVDIGTSVSNVKEIHYIVHGPRGVALISSISTPTLGFSGKETFTYYADAQPNQYIAEALVITTTDNTDITLHTSFANVQLKLGSLPLSLQYKPVNGKSGQLIRAVITRS